MKPTSIAAAALLGCAVGAAPLVHAQFSQSLMPLVAQATPAEKAGQARPVIDDREVALRVQSALFKDRRTSGLGLSVKASDGTVELSGRADSQSQADRAVLIARGVPGVRSVNSEIRVN